MIPTLLLPHCAAYLQGLVVLILPLLKIGHTYSAHRLLSYSAVQVNNQQLWKQKQLQRLMLTGLITFILVEISNMYTLKHVQ